MRFAIFIAFILIFFSCKQSKPKETLITDDFKYSGYYWHMNWEIPKLEFYLHEYIDIDKYGHFILMRHDKWRGKPSYYSGEINESIRNLIDSAFNNKKYKSKYAPPVGTMIYDGLSYCIEYKQNDSSNIIQFIPYDCPKEIVSLSSLLDKLIGKRSLQRIDSFDISSYTNELIKLDTSDGMMPLPHLNKPPKIEGIKFN